MTSVIVIVTQPFGGIQPCGGMTAVRLPVGGSLAKRVKLS